MKEETKKIGIIGAGFAGLAAASSLKKAKPNWEVHLFEKNENLGGRARQFSAEGFTFDMGPSWYWMPDVFETYFEKFDKKPSDFYDLVQLDPGFKMLFNESGKIEIPANYDELIALFDEIEPGSGKALEQFMAEAEYKYNVGVKDLVYQPGLSLLELIRVDLIKGVFKLQVFNSFSKHVRKYFKDPRLIALMEFPVLFLGAMPKDTPALYSLMNYAGLKQGTFYPIGGFGAVIQGMQKLAEDLGVQIHAGSAVSAIEVNASLVSGIKINDEAIALDALIAAADYHHVEEQLLPKQYRNYNKEYWDKKTFAPSSLLFYLGIDEEIKGLDHHNLFFDEDLEPHAIDIYKNKKWPDKPLFYVCCPSKTDSTVAPKGKENVFVLMPVAPGIEDNDSIREDYFNRLMDRLEKYLGTSIRDKIIYKRSYCIKDFIEDYNAYKGNAYGLANTLMQTANLKPRMQNKKIKNLFYAGQLTVPGPGVPPSLISGQVAAEQLIKTMN